MNLDTLVNRAQRVVDEFADDELTTDAVSELADGLADMYGVRADADDQIVVPHVGDRLIDAMIDVVNEYIVEDELTADAVAYLDELLTEGA
jgi:hypothetical protein